MFAGSGAFKARRLGAVGKLIVACSLVPERLLLRRGTCDLHGRWLGGIWLVPGRLKRSKRLVIFAAALGDLASSGAFASAQRLVILTAVQAVSNSKSRLFLRK